MSRVLVVEDSPTQALKLATYLSSAGFDVTTAFTAELAYECLKTQSVDLVLTDLDLPGKTGFDLCREIKRDPQWRMIPVVVLTASGDPLDVLRSVEAGADSFLSKERDFEEVAQRVRRVLERGAWLAGDGPCR